MSVAVGAPVQRSISALFFALGLAGCAGSRPALAVHEVADEVPGPKLAPRPEPVDLEKQRLHAEMKAALGRPDPVAQPFIENTAPVPLLPPLVRDGEPEIPTDAVAGSRLPAESVRRVMRLSAGRFRECHQRASLVTRVHGRVFVRFDIGPDGRVWRAEEERATLPDRELRQCLLDRLFELEFPSPGRQSVVVRYPWWFGGSEKPDTLPDADRTAEAPPPGFEEAMQSGISVAPALPPDPVPPVRAQRPTKCVAGDPMCSEL